ncbi:MAG: AAA family ATPase, partial [Hydrogenophaga sp.]|nr:AAA family ATPase [Hydrogenophaga sp.]
MHAIPPDLPRDEWVRVGMAAQAAGLTFDEFDAWSAGADSYEAAAARDTWRSFKPGKGIGAGTLFRMAGDHGRGSPRKAPGRPPEPPRAPRPGMGAAEVWARCKPATAAHPYIVAKQGTPEGLRVVPDADPLRIAGASVAGWLAVPVLPLAGGEPVSIQFVPPPGEGKKLNLPGASVAGVFIVGQLVQGGTAFLCEGVGQAWACWKATGAAAVVTFGWGRVRTVAAELRQRDASARLVLAPDVGKEADAERIARDVRAAVAAMPEGEPPNFDANDYALREGFDALEVLLSRASEPPPPEPRYRLLTADELRDLPPLAWCVRGVLPAVGLAALFGPSSSGKSFLGFDLAAAIAGGWRWFDHRVTPAPVVYAALEGEAGFKLRAQAWEMHRGRRLPDGLRLMLQPFKLTEPQDVADLAAVVPSGAVVFIDTLNRAAPTADENSSRDMGEILEAARQLQAATGGLVVLVHHTGKDAARGLRGHSSLFAAMDAAVEVSRDGDRREWKVSKSKDGQDGAAHRFGLEVLALGTDEHGDTITSCVVTPGEGCAGRTPRLTPAQRMAQDSLLTACERSGELAQAGELRGVHVEDWREVFYTGATADTQDGKKRAFQRARNDLCGAGLATVEADFYRPTDPALQLRIVGAIRRRAPGQNG